MGRKKISKRSKSGGSKIVRSYRANPSCHSKGRPERQGGHVGRNRECAAVRMDGRIMYTVHVCKMTSTTLNLAFWLVITSYHFCCTYMQGGLRYTSPHKGELAKTSPCKAQMALVTYLSRFLRIKTHAACEEQISFRYQRGRCILREGIHEGKTSNTSTKTMRGQISPNTWEHMASWIKLGLSVWEQLLTLLCSW